MRTALYVVVITLLFVGSVAATWLYTARARRVRKASWQQLVRRLVRVNRESLALVALDLIDENGSVRDVEWPELTDQQIWRMVDGLDGLDKILTNCDVFIDIAAHIQVTYPEAVVIAEELRRNARHIRWHIERIQAGAKNGHAADIFSGYAQRAVASYYLMGRQLLVLCEQTQFAGLEKLRVAV